jgi:protein-S-isoprenylcysteine O-methyltransferase Ste14
MSPMLATGWPLVVVIAALVTLGVTGNLFTAAPLVIVLQAAAVLLSVWARRSFQAGAFRVAAAPGAETMILRGPYRFIRHPMYAAVLLFMWSGIGTHLSIFTVVIGVVITAMVVARIFTEERLLQTTYPEYHHYMRKTKALVPYVI